LKKTDKNRLPEKYRNLRVLTSKEAVPYLNYDTASCNIIGEIDSIHALMNFSGCHGGYFILAM
jgi:hypothetical protein